MGAAALLFMTLIILTYVLSRGSGALSIDRFVALRLFARA
jgi:hypothetical protein